MMEFGKSTRVRFLGGELLLRYDGLEPLIIGLDDIVRRSVNLAFPFQRFQKYWFEAIDQNFSGSGEPVAWPALSKAYAGWKSRAYPGMPIMRRSDALYELLTSGTGDTIWRAGARSIEFGSRLPYFDFHQEGRGRNPWRPLIVMPPWLIRKLQAMVNEYIATGTTN